MFVTADQLYDYVTGLLHKANPTVQQQAPFWRLITDTATSDAYGYIVRGLVSRGFGSASQVPLWDDGANFQKAIGAYLALNAGGALGAFDDKFLEKLDRRKELATVQVTINGQWQKPDGTGFSPLEVGTGRVSSVPNGYIPHCW